MIDTVRRARAGFLERYVGRIRAAVCLVLSLVCGPAASAQAQADRWTAHTSMREVVALAASEDAIWAATTGGIFRFVPEGGEIQSFTAAEGLHSVQTRSIAYDTRRAVVWIGYSDGVIDRLDPATGVVETFFDIARNDRFTAREINRLVVQGDSLLVATAFGLVVFDPVRGEVRDAYTQLGALPPETAVRDVTAASLPDGRPGFWLATAAGLAYAPLDAPNLQDPSVWAVEQNGLPSASTWSVAAFMGSLYAGTERGLARREPGGTYTVSPITDRTVLDLAPLSDRLLAVDDFKLYGVFDAGGFTVEAEGFNVLNTVIEGPDGDVWVGDRQRGLNHFARPTGNNRPALVQGEIFPDGPFDGFFEDLTVDAQGNLWAAAAAGSAGSGFYRLSPDGQWTNYTGRFVEALAGRGSYRKVHADSEGNVWAASFGTGLAQVTPEGEVRVYDAANSTLRGANSTTNPNFVIVGGVASDEDGTLWVTNTDAARPLHVRTTDGQWTALPAPSCITSTTPLGPIFIDSFGNKWITVLELGDLRRTRGLLLLNTGASPTDPGDDVCRRLQERGSGGTGLPSIAITSVTEDREGLVWIGTEEGPAYVVSNAIVAGDRTEPVWPQWADRADGVYVLSGLRVNDIAVDPSNRLWMATNLGVYLVQQVPGGGYERVERFTADDTPLFSDQVAAVAVDGSEGEVYFASAQGLISFRGDALAPSPQKHDLFVYPNPVRVSGDASPDIFIDGLVEETRVHVVAPHGEVVARFDARGGRVRWDGRDLNRQLVPSGVYLIVAVGQNGEGAAYGKVAVIR